MHSLNSSLSVFSAETLIDIDSQNQHINLFVICNIQKQHLELCSHHTTSLNVKSWLSSDNNNHAIINLIQKFSPSKYN